MEINQLKKGMEVHLGIEREGREFELTTKVAEIGADMKGSPRLILNPFMFDGKIIELKVSHNGLVHFNLYADTTEEGRVCWKDVKIASGKVRGEDYYIVGTMMHRKNSVNCERRKNARLKLDIQGEVINKTIKEDYDCIIHDISNCGISFIVNREIEVYDSMLGVYFRERVNGKSYDINVDCKCVRRQKCEGGYLYGCVVSAASNELLTYVYIKKLLAKNLAISAKG